MSYLYAPSSFRAACTNVFAPDLVELLVDLGFRTYAKVLVRLTGIKAPQLDSKDEVERGEAEHARSYLVQWLIPFKFKNVLDLNRWPIHLISRQDAEQGTWCGEVYTCDKDGKEFSVTERLIEMGFGIAVRD